MNHSHHADQQHGQSGHGGMPGQQSVPAPGARHEGHHEQMLADFQRRFRVCLILTLPVLLLSPMIQHWLGVQWRFPLDLYLLLALSTIIYAYGGWPFLVGMLGEARARQPGMMTLVAVAITAAYVYSAAVVLDVRGEVFFWETATLIDIMLLGHWLEMRSVLAASRALQELARLMPETAHVVGEDGAVEDMPLGHLQPGWRLLIKPGEQVPADGRVLEGQSSVNEALLTGEALPVPKSAGDTVIGGSVNGEGSLQVEVQQTGGQTYLSQVTRLVQEAQETKSRGQDLANRAAYWLTIIALVGGTATLVVWLLIQSRFDFALERGITVMVIACPHALGLAVPLVVALSTALGARRGLLVRSRNALEQARLVQAVVFDKTGTLTEGRFGVDQVVSLGDLTEDEVLQLAAAVEAHSEHSIARGITAHAEERGLTVPQVADFRAIPGKGAEGTVGDAFVQVVSPGYLREHDIALPDQATEHLQPQGRTVVYLLRDHALAGVIALADVIRPESREAVRQLHEAGLQVMMLTGDHEQVAAWVARELGLDDYFAQVLPAEKARRVREIQERGLRVAMVGDGVNDAPALAQADIGLAIGAGTDVAVETADIVLVRNDPRAVLDLLRLSRAVWRKMVQNLAWAVGYNVIALPLAAGVLYHAGILVSPAVGAVLMSASTVIVAVNARLLRLQEPGQAPSGPTPTAAAPAGPPEHRHLPGLTEAPHGR